MTPFDLLVVALTAIVATWYLRHRREADRVQQIAKTQRQNVILQARRTQHKDDVRALFEMRENITRLEGELAEARVVVATEVVTAEEHQILLASICAHCGGIHSQACPRVKRLRFGTDGQRVEEVEFWPTGRWDETRVRWLEDLPPVAAPE